ncbi:TPA: hypothetical protein DCZ39_04730 [Patescibacteria group bacterium]|nr:hypothetical protein [Candidatus Gracilibacteria bacterium]
MAKKNSKASSKKLKRGNNELPEKNIGEAYKMESAILQVLKEIPLDEQKRLIKGFCEGNKKCKKSIQQLSSWDKDEVKKFILEHDVLNYFSEYSEEIAASMVELVPNEDVDILDEE